MSWKGITIVRIRDKGSIKGQKYGFLQYMEVASCIDKVDKTLGCIRLRCIEDDKVDYSPRCGSEVWKQIDLHAKIVLDDASENSTKLHELAGRRAYNCTFSGNNSILIAALLPERGL